MEIIMAVTELTDATFEETLKSTGQTVLVDFFAEWCNPCRMLSPVIDELSEEMRGVMFAKINVDRAKETAQRYGIMSVPTLMVFSNGRLGASFTGVASKSQITELISNVSGEVDV